LKGDRDLSPQFVSFRDVGALDIGDEFWNLLGKTAPEVLDFNRGWLINVTSWDQPLAKEALTFLNALLDPLEVVD
jgi:hypothetical protein